MSQGIEWVKRNQWRVRRMACLYYIDKRFIKSHPQHSLYTGLNDINPFQVAQRKNRTTKDWASQR